MIRWLSLVLMFAGCSPGEFRRGTTDVGVDAAPTHVVGAGDYPQSQSFVSPLLVDAGLVFLKNCGSDQILQQNDAGTAWTCVPSLATPVSIANGGTGAAMSCASGKVPIAQSSTALQCEAISGDCTTTSSGVVTCTQLQAGEITAGATTGTLTCAAGATACGITQSSTANATPTSMVDVPQVSTASSNQVGSSRGVQLSIPTGTALDGSFFVLRGATNKIFSVGGDQVSGSGGTYSNLCLFPGGGSTSACTDTNVTVQTSNQNVLLNTQTGSVGLAVAGSYMLRANNNSGEISINSGFNLSVGSSPGTYGGGQGGVIYLPNAGTTSSSACTSGVCLEALSGSFKVEDGAGANVVMNGQGISWSGSQAASFTFNNAGGTLGFTNGSLSTGTSLTIAANTTSGATGGASSLLGGGGATTGGAVNVTTGPGGGSATNGALNLSSGSGTTYSGTDGHVTAGNTPGVWNINGSALSKSQGSGSNGGALSTAGSTNFFYLPVVVNGISLKLVLSY